MSQSISVGWLLLWAVFIPFQASLAEGPKRQGEKPPKELMGLPLLIVEDFEKGSDAWLASDPKAWKLVKDGENQVFSQFQQSKVETPIRSPFNRAMLQGVVVEDFVLELDLQSTIKDYGHRDMCLFFGYKDPSHFYYVHFGKKADDHANQIFIVNEAPRLKISTESTPGTEWTNDWHQARIVRNVEEGAIEVYFDDFEKPAMKAVDKTFLSGEVGIGSFDDTGNFDNIWLFGKKTEPKE